MGARSLIRIEKSMSKSVRVTAKKKKFVVEYWPYETHYFVLNIATFCRKGIEIDLQEEKSWVFIVDVQKCLALL